MFAQPSLSKLISLAAAVGVGVLVGLVALLLGGCGARTSGSGPPCSTNPPTPSSSAREMCGRSRSKPVVGSQRMAGTSSSATFPMGA